MNMRNLSIEEMQVVAGGDAVIIYDNKNVHITVPIRWTGDAATPSNIATWENQLESLWSGQKGNFNVTLDVVSVGANHEGFAWTNTVDVSTGATASNGGHSYVSNSYEGHWTMIDYNNQVGPDGKVSVKPAGIGTFGHELGHLLGLEDGLPGLMSADASTDVVGMHILKAYNSPVNESVNVSGVTGSGGGGSSTAPLPTGFTPTSLGDSNDLQNWLKAHGMRLDNGPQGTITIGPLGTP